MNDTSEGGASSVDRLFDIVPNGDDIMNKLFGAADKRLPQLVVPGNNPATYLMFFNGRILIVL